MNHWQFSSTLFLSGVLLTACSTTHESEGTSSDLTADASTSSATAADSSASETTSDTTDSQVCVDSSLGNGQTPRPTSEDAFGFTTALEACSLSASEIAFCAGEDPSSSITESGDTRLITGNAIPNHDAALFPNSGNPNTISGQNIAYSVTMSPVKGDNPTDVRVSGVALNGIKMEPATAEVYSGGQWRYEALLFAGRLDDDTVSMPGTSLGLDCNFAHVQPTGEYHYHGVPTGLMPETPQITLVGWAADGFPILGRYGYNNANDTSSETRELLGSYRLQNGERQPLSPNDTATPPGEYDGTFVQDWIYDETVGDLDECNGRDGEVTIDGVTYPYTYYLTHTYPFMPRCVWGTPDASFAGPPN